MSVVGNNTWGMEFVSLCPSVCIFFLLCMSLLGSANMSRVAYLDRLNLARPEGGLLWHTNQHHNKSSIMMIEQAFW